MQIKTPWNSALLFWQNYIASGSMQIERETGESQSIDWPSSVHKRPLGASVPNDAFEPGSADRAKDTDVQDQSETDFERNSLRG